MRATEGTTVNTTNITQDGNGSLGYVSVAVPLEPAMHVKALPATTLAPVHLCHPSHQSLYYISPPTVLCLRVCVCVNEWVYLHAYEYVCVIAVIY